MQWLLQMTKLWWHDADAAWRLVEVCQPSTRVHAAERPTDTTAQRILRYASCVVTLYLIADSICAIERASWLQILPGKTVLLLAVVSWSIHPAQILRYTDVQTFNKCLSHSQSIVMPWYWCRDIVWCIASLVQGQATSSTNLGVLWTLIDEFACCWQVHICSEHTVVDMSIPAEELLPFWLSSCIYCPWQWCTDTWLLLIGALELAVMMCIS